MEALRRDLHDLELNGVEEREEEIDRGSYGKVVIVFYKGLKYVFMNCPADAVFLAFTINKVHYFLDNAIV